MSYNKKILLGVIGFLAAMVMLLSCDFQGSLLAPDSRIQLDDEPFEIMTDEFGAQYAAGRYTVAFHPGTPHSEIREFAQSVGDEIHRFNESLSWVYVRSDRLVAEVEQDWRQPEWTQIAVRDYLLTIIGFAEDDDTINENNRKSLSLQIDDPLFDEQWGLKRIRAHKVWDMLEVRGEGVNVGILDGPWYDPAINSPDPSKNVTSFSDNHEDLDGAWHGVKPLISNNRIAERIHQKCEGKAFPIIYTYKNCWERELSHATHVGGIIGAPINDMGIVGVAPNSRLMPLYATWIMTNESFSEGIQKLINEDADVINISMGLSRDFRLPVKEIDFNEWTKWMSKARELWAKVLKEAHNEGVFLVNAAGNNNDDAGLDMFSHIVSIVPNGIVVGATGGIFNQDTRWSSSNYGLIVEIYAPGRSILSTVPCLLNVPCAETGYDRKSGTSMAAPHVAGVAALIYSVAKERFGERPTPEAVKEAIIEGSRNGGVFINNVVNEVPRLDAFEAVRYYLREACPRATNEIAAKVSDICPQELYN